MSTGFPVIISSKLEIITVKLVLTSADDPVILIFYSKSAYQVRRSPKFPSERLIYILSSTLVSWAQKTRIFFTPIQTFDVDDIYNISLYFYMYVFLLSDGVRN